MSYYSQFNQDRHVNEHFFKNKKDGIFIDVGAHDGININNTYFFEKELGWKGICIEPIPSVYKELEKNRKCKCVNGCAYNYDGNLIFNIQEGYTEMLSGVYNDYDPLHLNRINNETKQMGGNSKLIESKCYTINTLCKDLLINYVDYLSIDTEGSELKVLQGINFDEILIHVIDVEDNYPDTFEPIQKLLEENNFSYYAKLGGDAVFVNKSNKIKK